MNDVLLSKKASLERCIRHIRQYYGMKSDVPFAEDHLRKDALAMNLQRACELVIDIANYLIKVRKLGLPQDSRQSFLLLKEAGIVDVELADHLQARVGFRNVLVHEYQEINWHIVHEVIENRLDELVAFSNIALEAVENN